MSNTTAIALADANILIFLCDIRGSVATALTLASANVRDVFSYGVATVSRIDKIIGLFSKIDL